MPQTLIPPVSLDENSFEQMIAPLSRLPRDSGTLNIDLGRVEFVDPYGMAGILLLGQHLTRRGHKLLLHLPISMAVQRCLDRMEFFRYLSEFYRMYPPYRPLAARARRDGPSEVLLEITRIAQGEDIPAIVRKVKDRARAILETHLLDDEGMQGFLEAVSEISQNIIEHSRHTGLVGIQKYSDEKGLEKNMIRIAAMDLGIGFKKSLEPRLGLRYGEKWSDLIALEEALLHGASRNQKPARRHGLSAVEKFVRRWGGTLSIRSGTAKLSLKPDRERGTERETRLPEFPGAQISLTLPEGSHP
jgi:Histidine kinase-, DNA gyrase B-, and HSP90-like ATPase